MDFREEQKQLIIKRLKAEGYRMTKQRRVLLDIIFEEEFSSCKEIYYKASKINPEIGTATVYRMINMLEERGVLLHRYMFNHAFEESAFKVAM